MNLLVVDIGDPGPTKNGFKGFCSVFVTAAFSYGQSEFVALSAAEQPNPRKAIPTACRLIFWRIIVLFLGLYHCWFACAIELGPFDE